MEHSHSAILRRNEEQLGPEILRQNLVPNKYYYISLIRYHGPDTKQAKFSGRFVKNTSMVGHIKSHFDNVVEYKTNRKPIKRYGGILQSIDDAGQRWTFYENKKEALERSKIKKSVKGFIPKNIYPLNETLNRELGGTRKRKKSKRKKRTRRR